MIWICVIGCLQVLIANLADHMKDPTVRRQCTACATALEASTHQLHKAQDALFPAIVDQINRQLNLSAVELSPASQVIAVPAPQQVLQQAQQKLDEDQTPNSASFAITVSDWKAAVLQANRADEPTADLMEQLAQAALSLLERQGVIKAALTIREHLEASQKATILMCLHL